jgi:hypothetical protein
VGEGGEGVKVGELCKGVQQGSRWGWVGPEASAGESGARGADGGCWRCGMRALETADAGAGEEGGWREGGHERAGALAGGPTTHGWVSSGSCALSAVCVGGRCVGGPSRARPDLREGREVEAEARRAREVGECERER